MKFYEWIKAYIRQRSKTIIRGLVFCSIIITSGGIFLFSTPIVGVAVWKQFIVKSAGAFVLAIITVLGTGLGEFMKNSCLKPKLNKIFKQKKKRA